MIILEKNEAEIRCKRGFEQAVLYVYFVPFSKRRSHFVLLCADVAVYVIYFAYHVRIIVVAIELIHSTDSRLIELIYSIEIGLHPL